MLDRRTRPQRESGSASEPDPAGPTVLTRAVRRLLAGALLTVLLWLPAVAAPAAVHAAVCTGWTSTTVPPPTIRVYRTGLKVVQTVDFETYVKTVMPAEWPSNWPIESLRAGAVAIKQYAWYYTIHYRGGTSQGNCYDVVDNSNDQVYAPESVTIYPSHVQAVESTWPESVLKGGSFILTGYRPGAPSDPCAPYNGYLNQQGARTCALLGDTGEQILQIYYGPGVVVQGTGTAPDPPTAVSAVGYDTSAQVSWTAPVSDGGSPIIGYTVTSAPGGKTCTTTGTPTCAVAGLTNGTTYAFTVTATNLVGTSGPSAPSNNVVPAVVPGATFVPLNPPVRYVDTRAGNGLTARLTAGVPATFYVTAAQRPYSPGSTSVPNPIPADATAVTGNLTVTGSTFSWAVYLGPDPVANPGSSTINFNAGETTANGVTVALGAGGSLSATYLSQPGNTTDLVFDVTGYFVPDLTGATYHPMTPARLLDTRVKNGLGGKLLANTPVDFDVTAAHRSGSPVPAGATAVTGNVTVVNETFAWAIYVGPVADASPGTSTLNFNRGDIKANNVTVTLGSEGELWLTYMSTAGNTTDLVFDVTGYYTADATGSVYVPIDPARLLDSRSNNGLTGKLPANTSTSLQVSGRACVPLAATAVTGNVTVTNPSSPWAIYVGDVSNSSPSTSTLNFTTGQTKANGVTAALGSGGVLWLTYMSIAGQTTDVVFDVSGYFERPG
jgi:Stage II sporulation protein/Fibronectin type III domain